MSERFGRMVDEAAVAQGLKNYQLQVMIGLYGNQQVFSAKQLDRVRKGQYRFVPPEVVGRLIALLGLPADDAWEAAMEPLKEELESYRRFRTAVSQVAVAGGRALKHQLGNRRPADRRRADRRRRPVPAELGRAA